MNSTPPPSVSSVAQEVAPSLLLRVILDNQRMGHHGAFRTWSLLNMYYPGHSVPLRIVQDEGVCFLLKRYAIRSLGGFRLLHCCACLPVFGKISLGGIKKNSFLLCKLDLSTFLPLASKFTMPLLVTTLKLVSKLFKKCNSPPSHDTS